MLSGLPGAEFARRIWKPGLYDTILEGFFLYLDDEQVHNCP